MIKTRSSTFAKAKAAKVISSFFAFSFNHNTNLLFFSYLPSEMIGTAKTLINYKSPDSREKLIFEVGEELILYGYKKDKKRKLYIAQVNWTRLVA